MFRFIYAASLLSCFVSSLYPCVGSLLQSTKDGNELSGKATEGVALAFLLPSIGILCSCVGFFAVNTDAKGAGWDVNLGTLMWVSLAARTAVSRFLQTCL